nr:DUF5999 family protein [Actinoplanes solisilvae]
MCTHSPECPPIDMPGWDTAALLVHHEDLGWSMLCNGAILIDAAVQPAPAPVVTEMPARVERTRSRTRTRKAVPAATRRRTVEPIAA